MLLEKIKNDANDIANELNIISYEVMCAIDRISACI